MIFLKGQLRSKSHQLLLIESCHLIDKLAKALTSTKEVKVEEQLIHQIFMKLNPLIKDPKALKRVENQH